ncbi:MAG: hypothetical protein KAQ64_04850 [Candidatus Pacebacteria bacterium]|nr:hypothetical protein [Candidatus Paceibacterota bacterium]
MKNNTIVILIVFALFILGSIFILFPKLRNTNNINNTDANNHNIDLDVPGNEQYLVYEIDDSGKIEVFAENFKFQPDEIKGSAGEKIKIDFYNKDSVAHNLKISGLEFIKYEVDLSNIEEREDREEAMEGIRDMIERRLNSNGMGDYTVKALNDNEIYIKLKNTEKRAEIIKIVETDSVLEFREEMTSEEKNEVNEELKELNIPEEYFSQYHQKNSGLGGEQLVRSEVVFNPNNYKPEVQIKFNDEGKELFSEITKRNIGKMLGIYLDQMPISKPIVNEPILDGRAIISGNFTLEEAMQLSRRINNIVLSLPMKLSGEQAEVLTKTIQPQQKDTIDFFAPFEGEYEYFCSIYGHKNSGMKGLLIIE